MGATTGNTNIIEPQYIPHSEQVSTSGEEREREGEIYGFSITFLCALLCWKSSMLTFQQFSAFWGVGNHPA